jgi:hypothetical protein
MTPELGKPVQFSIAGDARMVAQHNTGHGTPAAAITHDIDDQWLGPIRDSF